MGKVPIWAQWLGVAAGVLLSSAFVPFVTWFMGWSRMCRLWTRREVAPGLGRRTGAVPRG